MTQISVGTLVRDAASLAPVIPRPRQVEQPEPPAALRALLPATPPAGVPTRSRPRQVGRWSVVLDLALALALATAAAGLGVLPLEVAVPAATAWVLVSWAAGHYRPRALGESRVQRVRLVLVSGIRASVIVLAATPWLDVLDPAALAGLVAALSVVSAAHLLLGARRHRPRLVLAGRPRDVREALIELQSADTHEIVAACLTRTSRVPLGDLPTYLGLHDSSDVARRHQADAVVVLPGARLAPSDVRRLHWALAGVGAELYLGTGLLDVEPQRARVLSTAGMDVLHITPPVLGGPRRVLKDVVERSLALLALVVTLPLLALLCLAIRLETSGPALFRQERIGRDGVPFTMLKLRSMGLDAEAERSGLVLANERDGVLFKIQLDPRVTSLGRRLRRYSLDELPQLWNVVRGDMSLVGPRPALPCEVAKYDVDPRRRLVVKPGVTGLWQVSGRSDLTWSESVRLDLRYVENWSLGLDVTILLRTVRAVLGHRGAY